MLNKPKPTTPQSDFMEHIQEHERTWGQESYPGRPNLTEILEAPVVVFWQIEDKSEHYTITIHENLDDIERFLGRMLLISNVETPRKRIARMYQAQQRVKVRGIKIEFGHEDESST